MSGVEDMLEVAREVPVWKRLIDTETMVVYYGKCAARNCYLMSYYIDSYRYNSHGNLGDMFALVPKNKHLKHTSGEEAKSLYEIADEAYHQQRFFRLLPPRKGEALPWYRRIGR